MQQILEVGGNTEEDLAPSVIPQSGRRIHLVRPREEIITDACPVLSEDGKWLASGQVSLVSLILTIA